MADKTKHWQAKLLRAAIEMSAQEITVPGEPHPGQYVVVLARVHNRLREAGSQLLLIEGSDDG